MGAAGEQQTGYRSMLQALSLVPLAPCTGLRNTLLCYLLWMMQATSAEQ